MYTYIRIAYVGAWPEFGILLEEGILELLEYYNVHMYYLFRIPELDTLRTKNYSTSCGMVEILTQLIFQWHTEFRSEVFKWVANIHTMMKFKGQYTL